MAAADDRDMLELIRSLSLEEKCALCSGIDFWNTCPIPEKGIPSLRMADGPHGVRIEDARNKKKHGGHSKPATCFPSQVAQACAWDPQLTRQAGQAMAEECLHYGVGLLLGPGVNIKRSVLCGRNFEYYSEDPYLSGKLAIGFIQGAQQAGVGTSLKHFASNSQEYLRMSINSAVDERALFDIYLKAFEMAVTQAHPDTVMASYNRVNGRYATENRRLLTDILRLRLGFQGAVVSDWGAVNNRPAGIAAGLDLEMPGSGGVNDYAILQAVQSGILTEDELDAACWNVLRLVFRRSRADKPAPACNWKAHHELAGKIVEKSAVLLKNDGMLPLSQDSGRVAVIGQMAEKPRYQGGGSSAVNPKQLDTFLAAMKSAGHPFVYTPGYHGLETSPSLVAAAVAAAKSAENTLLFLGLPDSYECEGYDRSHMQLPENQLELLRKIHACSKNLCVVLCCGSPVETPWLEDVNSLLCLHLAGQAQGKATVRLLYGQANPSGKLAESWPLQLEDTPAFHHFPMGPNYVSYNESIYVGYRYYDSAKQPVRFPFGFGLSYTRFAYSDLVLSHTHLPEGKTLQIRCKVTNTGSCAGEEIVQFYYSQKQSVTYQAEKQLAAFARTALLQPGESQEVLVEIPWKQFAFHDTLSSTAVVEAGDYEIFAARSSRDLPLSAPLSLEGVDMPARGESEAFYKQISDNSFPQKAFEKIYKQSHTLDNTPPQKGLYHTSTPLGLMTDSRTGRTLLGLAHTIGKLTIHFSKDHLANRKAAYSMTRDLPFKNFVINSSGIISPKAAHGLLEMCNGRPGFGLVIRGLLQKRPYRRLPHK